MYQATPFEATCGLILQMRRDLSITNREIDEKGNRDCEDPKYEQNWEDIASITFELSAHANMERVRTQIPKTLRSRLTTTNTRD
jgi:hypothetical protein